MVFFISFHYYYITLVFFLVDALTESDIELLWSLAESLLIYVKMEFSVATLEIEGVV